jgi:hypothetical protein
MTITMVASATRQPDRTITDAAGLCYATVSQSGRLRVHTTRHDVAGLFPLARRTATGTAYRIPLDGGITCWLDGDHQDGSGEINIAASRICAALSRRPFTDPWDAPFVCGPVLFTGPSRAGAAAPVGLSDAQLARIADAHATAEQELSTEDACVEEESAWVR